MATLYSVDFPFLVFVIFFQLFFAFITFLISYFSFRIYRLTHQEQSRSLLIAFLLIFFSYAIQTAFNLLILLEINPEFYVMFGIHPLSVFYNQGLFLHVFFMTMGITFLLFTTFKIKSKKLILVLLFPTLLVLIFAKRLLLLGFFMITSFYLFFVFHHSFLNYLEHKKKKPLLIMLAFFFLLLAQLIFLFMGANPNIYFTAHVFNFIAYSLILFNLILIIK